MPEMAPTLAPDLMPAVAPHPPAHSATCTRTFAPSDPCTAPCTRAPCTAHDQLQSTVPFAPEYVRLVLNENFEDAKTLLLDPLLAIHDAHLVMLAECGIVSREDARVLRGALRTIEPDVIRRVAYDGSCEDLFFYVERLIVQAAGDAVAGRLHTARSRNDIDMTMYRMQQREMVLGLLAATLDLRDALVAIADAHRDTIFPAHTHTQPAQPTTLAHYLLGVIEELERGAVRFTAAVETINRCPLGACAITGTGFPIDRQRTSDLLGFAGPTGNTYGSIATVDYLLESLGAASVTLVGLGRVVQDLLLWCTAEVRYLRLGDGFVQASSIMPQKRNPVALEHARAIGSKALGQATAILMSVHNTPFGDIVDSEDDLQPLVASAFRDATRAVSLVAAALGDATFDVETMRRRAAESWITVTELADTLTRDHGLPFSQSHAIAAGLIRVRREQPEPARSEQTRSEQTLSQALAAVSAQVTGTAIVYDQARLDELLSPEHFVRVRRTLGGPAPAVTAEAIGASRARLAEDRRALAAARARLTDAAARRRAAVDAL
jgi:argininosuccinate lyase